MICKSLQPEPQPPPATEDMSKLVAELEDSQRALAVAQERTSTLEEEVSAMKTRLATKDDQLATKQVESS